MPDPTQKRPALLIPVRADAGDPAALWAEDQKAMAALADQRKQPPVVVAV